MTNFDRRLALEFIIFSLLGLLAVIVIYDLINLIDKLPFFIRYKAGVMKIILYYVYDLPATGGLLLPVGFSLGTFLVMGRLIRSNELIPLLAGGVNIFRIFAVFLGVSVLVAIFAFLETEFVATAAKTRFEEFTKEDIQNRQLDRGTRRINFHYVSASGMMYEIKQLNLKDSTITGWLLAEYGPGRRVIKSIMVERARYTPDGKWEGENVEIHDFSKGEEIFTRYPRRMLKEVSEPISELALRGKGTDEMRLGELMSYIRRMRKAGSNVSMELYDFHFRFSSPVIIVLVILISLIASSLLPKGNLALGIGLGLLMSFIYWGLIQFTRPVGYNGYVAPWIAAWASNILFFLVTGVLLTKVKS